jgi:hypothetical protein
MPRLHLILAGFLAAAASPTFAQTAQDDPGITVDPGATLRHRAPVRYPKGSLVAGTVEIDAGLSAKGEVNDPHVVSGPEELRKEALWSVLQWHYLPGTATPVHVSIRFDSSADSSRQPAPRATNGDDDDFVSGILKTIEFTGLAPDAENELRAQLPFHEGDPMLHSDFGKITNIVQAFDEHLTSDVTGRIAAPDAHRDLTIHIHAVTPVAAVLIDSQERAEKPRVTLRK